MGRTVPQITAFKGSLSLAIRVPGLQFVTALLAMLIALAFPLRAVASEPHVFVGSVGVARVVMELEGDADAVTGRYFYRKYRLDIGLSGVRTKDALVLEARTSGDRIVLRRTRTGMAGTLTTKAGRQLPIKLLPAGPDDAVANPMVAGLTGLSPYQRAQLGGLALVPGKLRQQGPRTLRDWREPVSGLGLFRIEHGYPQPVMDTINAALERQHWEQVANWFSCEGFDGVPGIDIAEERAVFLDDRFVSYAWFSSWSCAGTAHPDFGTQGFTFDAQTGRQLELEDVIYFGKMPPPDADTPAFYAYRSEIFAPKIVELLRKLYPDEMPRSGSETNEDDCDYADPSVWDFPSWYMTKDGLYLGAYFARVQRPCDEPEWSIIPWDHLNRRMP